MESIHKKQIQLIKIGQKKLGLSDAAYRRLLHEKFGVSSSTELTSIQAGKLITLFVESGFKVTKKDPQTAGNRSVYIKGPKGVRLVSVKEKRKIAALNRLIGWPDEAFHKWMKKRYGIENIGTHRDAFMVIEGLKGVFEHRMTKKYGDAWWTKEFGSYPIKEYIRRHH